MALVDTSVLIHILEGTKKGIFIADEYEYDLVAITAISVNEVLRGTPRNKREEVVRFLLDFKILSLDAKAALKSVEIEDELCARGKPLSKPDLFIAAISLVHDLPLLTMDRDFESVPSLKLLMPP